MFDKRKQTQPRISFFGKYWCLKRKGMEGGWESHFADAEANSKRHLTLFDDSGWKIEKKKGDTHVYSRGSAGGFWLKVTARFEVGDLKELIDILDTSLSRRQKQWHHLLIEGDILRWWRRCMANVQRDRSNMTFL